MYDADLLPPATVLYNGKDLSNQRISSNSFTANVKFPFDVTQAELNGITINNGASVSAVIGNDNKSATLSISSLADRGVYTLSIPAIGTNPAKEVKFIAANDSGYLFRAEFDGADDTTH